MTSDAASSTFRLAITVLRNGTGVISIGGLSANLAGWTAAPDGGQFFANITPSSMAYQRDLARYIAGTADADLPPSRTDGTPL